MMSKLPNAAQVEAARNAAQRTYDALADMAEVDLEVQVISEDEAASTNSLDQVFLDYLSAGRHLNEGFLANAK